MSTAGKIRIKKEGNGKDAIEEKWVWLDPASVIDFAKSGQDWAHQPWAGLEIMPDITGTDEAERQRAVKIFYDCELDAAKEDVTPDRVFAAYGLQADGSKHTCQSLFEAAVKWNSDQSRDIFDPQVGNPFLAKLVHMVIGTHGQRTEPPMKLSDWNLELAVATDNRCDAHPTEPGTYINHKLSAHITVRRLAAPWIQQRDFNAQSAMKLLHANCFVDTTIYGAKRALRSPGACKEFKLPPIVLENGDSFTPQTRNVPMGKRVCVWDKAADKFIYRKPDFCRLGLVTLTEDWRAHLVSDVENCSITSLSFLSVCSAPSTMEQPQRPSMPATLHPLLRKYLLEKHGLAAPHVVLASGLLNWGSADSKESHKCCYMNGDKLKYHKNSKTFFKFNAADGKLQQGCSANGAVNKCKSKRMVLLDWDGREEYKKELRLAKAAERGEEKKQARMAAKQEKQDEKSEEVKMSDYAVEIALAKYLKDSCVVADVEKHSVQGFLWTDELSGEDEQDTGKTWARMQTKRLRMNVKGRALQLVDGALEWLTLSDPERAAKRTAGTAPKQVVLDLAAEYNACQLKNTKIGIEGSRSWDDIFKETLPHLHKPKTAFLIDRSGPDLLPSKGGTVTSLRDGSVVPRTKEHLFSCELDVQIDKDAAKAARVQKWFLGTCGGDTDKCAFLQRCLGYCLSADMSARKILVLVGDGSNGKGVIEKMLEEILGVDKFYTKSSPDVIFQTDNGASDGAATPQLEALAKFGKRLATLSEGKKNAQFNQVVTKGIVGGDSIYSRALFGEGGVLQLLVKLLVFLNFRPQLDVTDRALVDDRLLFIQFDTQFVEEPTAEGVASKSQAKKDTAECDWMRSKKPDGGLNAVFTWMIEGAKKYYSYPAGSGLSRDVPACITRQKEEYIKEQDPVGRWLNLAVERDSSHRTGAQALFEAFTKRAGARTERKISIQDFKKRAEQLGFIHGCDKRGNFWKVKLSPAQPAPACDSQFAPLPLGNLVIEGQQPKST